MSKLVNFFYEIGSLRKIMRAHRQSFLSDDLSDNIASHSYRVSVIGYFLAKQEQADIAKVMAMCLFHDIGEARSGDQNWIHKRYVKVFEDEIIADQLEHLTPDQAEYNLAKEYQARQTLEAKVAKDADLLDQALLVQEYIQAGNQEAHTWHGPEKIDQLSTATAKQLYQQINTTKPSHWWKDVWTSQRR